MVYHVYILSSAAGVLYTGVTNHLERRTIEHKQKIVPGFTQQYEIDRLVHFEGFNDVRNAIAREKQIKRWRLRKEISANPPPESHHT